MNTFPATILYAFCVLLFATTGISASSVSRLDRINQSGEIKVCIWPDYFAISYRNPRTGELEGIDIDMAHALASELAVKLTFVDSSFAELIKNMNNDACDIAMHSVAIREDRRAHMDFSAAHLISGIYAVSMKTNLNITRWSELDQEGNIIVVQKGTYMEPVMRNYLKKADLSVVNSFKAREQEIQSGRGDAFMTDYPYGRRMTALTRWARLLEPETPLAPTPYAYAVPKNDPRWLQTVNNFLKTVKADGRLAASAARHGLSPIVAP